MSDTAQPMPASMGEAEIMIMRLIDEIEERVNLFSQECDASARAEADWKLAYHRALVAVDRSSDRPSDAETRKAKATLNARSSAAAIDIVGEPVDLYERHLAAERIVESSREALRSLREAVGAYRTLAANIRSVDTVGR